MATRSTGKSQGNSSSSSSSGGTAKGRSSTSGTRRKARTSEASASGATARARISSMRDRRPGTSRPKAKPSSTEPTVTATDDVLAASNAQRALNPDMPRVAWLRTQLQNLEAQRAERLMKVAQLTLIAIVFITFVIQNSQGVNVHFLLFALNIRLIWVIFGCGVLGGVAGYLIGRPEKSLRALLPQREQKSHHRTGRRPAARA